MYDLNNIVGTKTQERELAYLIKIDSIEPIVGSDNCEAAIVGGWRIMVRKNTFKPGDIAIYFEIDSQVPATEEFAFLASKHYKVKTHYFLAQFLLDFDLIRLILSSQN